MPLESDFVELTVSPQPATEDKSVPVPTESKTSTSRWSSFATFIREGVFSFYRDGTPYSTRTGEILWRTGQTAFALYAAWGTYWESNKYCEKTFGDSETARSFILLVNALFVIGSFIAVQKLGGKGIHFLGHYAKQLSSHEKWLIGLAKEDVHLAELIEKTAELAGKDDKDYKEIQTAAKDIATRIKSGEYIKKLGLFGSFSSTILTSSQSNSEIPSPTITRTPSMSQSQTGV